MLLHGTVIWANMLVCLQLSTMAAGFIFTQWLPRKELYIYMANKFGHATFTCL